MEILIRGNPNSRKYRKKFICKECGCEYIADNTEYDLPDFWEEMHDGIEAVCKCPSCGARNVVLYDRNTQTYLTKR